VASSSNVEVYANRLERNADGLGLKQDARGSGSRGRHVSKNFYAHHNVVVMCEGHTGAVRSAGVGSAIFGKRNNRFEKNRYRVGSPGGTWWHWQNSPSGRGGGTATTGEAGSREPPARAFFYGCRAGPPLPTGDRGCASLVKFGFNP
jgi:hypothetical protein